MPTVNHVCTQHALAARNGYAVITPVRDEGRNLTRLAFSLLAQTVQPSQWIVVDTGSSDDTVQIAHRLASFIPWMVVLAIDGPPVPTRGAPVVAALHHGLELVSPDSTYVAKIDADVSFDHRHVETLLVHFGRERNLGIASGARYERHGSRWRPYRATATTVEAQARFYRRECLLEVVPLVERMGWDVLDESRALSRGWSTATIEHAAFRHHRPVGARDSSARSAWIAQGQVAHYAGYAPLYLATRAAYRSLRTPSAMNMLLGFASAKLARSPRTPDTAAIAVRRRQQRLRHLPRRATEVLLGGAMPARALRRADLLIASNAGGHLLELVSLDDAFRRFSRVWIVPDTPDAHELLAGETTRFVSTGAARNLARLVRNLAVATWVVCRVRPRVAISSGSSAAVPFLWMAWLFGARIVFLECGGRTDGASLSRRLVDPLADRVYVQWGDQADQRHAISAGKALLARTSAVADRISAPATAAEVGVLVTLGTCEYGFERLLREIEPAASRDGLMIVQSGSTTYDVRGALSVDMLPPSTLFSLMRRARAVVCHAGIGSVALALAAGHVPLVLPRRADLNEQVDDHQVGFARALQASGLATLITDGPSLAATLTRGTRASARPEIPDLMPDLLEYLTALLGGSRPPVNERPANHHAG